MSLPEPPPNVPRIVEVQNPATNHHVVYVRMPTNLAAKWPDKPWGTSIADIGLSKKESDRYPDYTLVDIEPLKGTPDLYWVFQKLDGPVWTTKSQGQDSLIPAKYRRLVVTTESKQEVEQATLPDAIEGDLVRSVVQQQMDTGKAVKVNTEETIDTNADPLTGERFAPNGAILATEEALVEEGDSAEKGVNIAQSDVSPTGDGKAVKETLTAKRRTANDGLEEGWPKKQVKSIGVDDLVPQKFKKQTISSVDIEQVALAKEDVDDIPEPVLPNDVTVRKVEHEKVNDWRYEKRISKEEIAPGADPLSGMLTDTWGVNSSEELLTEEGSSVASGFGVKSSRVTPLGDGKAIKETERFPAVDDPVNAPHVVYTLTEEDTDPLTKVPVTIKKSLVNAAHAESLAQSMRSAGWFTEIRALDKWHSILISSQLSAGILAVEQTWRETGNISLPDVLLEIGVIWDGNKDGSSGASGVENIPYIIAEDLRWSVEAEANASAVVTGRPYTKIKKGYSGPAQVTVTRTFHSSPPQNTVSPTNFGEVYGTLTIYGTQKNTVGKASETGKADKSLGVSLVQRSHQDNNMAIHFFGPVVHSNVTLQQKGDSPTQVSVYVASGGSTPDGGSYPAVTADASISGSATLELPPSGAPLGTGNTFVVGVSVSYYKLGYWVRETRIALVP
jgi:hypothetical protein